MNGQPVQQSNSQTDPSTVPSSSNAAPLLAPPASTTTATTPSTGNASKFQVINVVDPHRLEEPLSGRIDIQDPTAANADNPGRFQMIRVDRNFVRGRWKVNDYEPPENGLLPGNNPLINMQQGEAGDTALTNGMGGSVSLNPDMAGQASSAALAQAAASAACAAATAFQQQRLSISNQGGAGPLLPPAGSGVFPNPLPPLATQPLPPNYMMPNQYHPGFYPYYPGNPYGVSPYGAPPHQWGPFPVGSAYSMPAAVPPPPPHTLLQATPQSIPSTSLNAHNNLGDLTRNDGSLSDTNGDNTVISSSSSSSASYNPVDLQNAQLALYYAHMNHPGPSVPPTFLPSPAQYAAQYPAALAHYHQQQLLSSLDPSSSSQHIESHHPPSQQPQAKPVLTTSPREAANTTSPSKQQQQQVPAVSKPSTVASTATLVNNSNNNPVKTQPVTTNGIASPVEIASQRPKTTAPAGQKEIASTFTHGAPLFDALSSSRSTCEQQASSEQPVSLSTHISKPSKVQAIKEYLCDLACALPPDVMVQVRKLLSKSFDTKKSEEEVSGSYKQIQLLLVDHLITSHPELALKFSNYVKRPHNTEFATFIRSRLPLESRDKGEAIPVAKEMTEGGKRPLAQMGGNVQDDIQERKKSRFSNQQ